MKIIKSIQLKYFNITTKNKLLISYILVVFIPALIIGIVLITSLSNMALNITNKQVNDDIYRIKKEITNVLTDAEAISADLFTDLNLQELINQEYQSDVDVFKSYYQYKTFSEYKLLHKEIKFMRVYTSNNTILDNWQFMKANKVVKNSDWFKDAIKNNGDIVWSYMSVLENNNNNPSLYLTRRLSNDASKYDSVLMIGIDSSYLTNILKMENFQIILADGNENIITSNDASLKVKTIKQIGISQPKDMEGNYIDFQKEGTKYRVFYEKLAARGVNFNIISLFPVNFIMLGVNKIYLLGFVVMGITLVTAFCLIVLFSTSLSKRITLISKDMHKVAGGNLEITSNIQGEDEIGKLSEDLNLLIYSIKGLISDKEQGIIQNNLLMNKQKEIKYKILANQINPHFLFNVLETIRMKACCNNEIEIADIVQQLGKILRKNIEMKSDPIHLCTEVDLVKSYLTIQKFRYGEKLNYHIIIPHRLDNYYILPMILQPVVENAVIHGLEKKEERGNITIEATVREHFFILTVTDDGVGMTDKQVSELIYLLNVTDDYRETHIGLQNVHQRLKIKYGSEYGIRIISNLNIGTKVSIYLPYKEVNFVKSSNS